MSKCDGIVRTAQGTATLIALATDRENPLAKEFIAKARLLPGLATMPEDELVEELMAGIAAIPLVCPKCGESAS